MTQPQREIIKPSLSPAQAISLLREQLKKGDEIEAARYDDPVVKKWRLTTINILDMAFGRPDGERHQNTGAFDYGSGSLNYGGFRRRGPSFSERQQEHERRTAHRKAVLESAIEQLEISGPPITPGPASEYRPHPEIERVSGQLFEGGHYKQAALEAYIRVIDEVRKVSGLALDGDRLMNRAFGCENQTPVIQFNTLQTEPDKDEQKGFLFLFKGIVSLRNLKAHSNRLFDDSDRAHDYLALASLLMRVLEIATVNPPTET